MTDKLDDVACVGAFLAMAEREGLMLNARKGSEAFEAFCRLVGLSAGKMRSLARDPDVDSIIKSAGG